MTTKTLSLEQAAYLAALANYDAIDAASAQAEADFLAASGAKDASGQTPARLFMIAELDEFERLCTEFENSPFNLANDLQIAAQLLTAAEEALLAWALDLAPEPIRAVLAKGISDSCATRKKLIDLALRLDVSTVPQRRAAV